MSRFDLLPYIAAGWTVGFVVLVVAFVVWGVRMERRIARDVQRLGGTRTEGRALVSLIDAEELERRRARRGAA